MGFWIEISISQYFNYVSPYDFFKSELSEDYTDISIH